MPACSSPSPAYQGPTIQDRIEDFRHSVEAQRNGFREGECDADWWAGHPFAFWSSESRNERWYVDIDPKDRRWEASVDFLGGSRNEGVGSVRPGFRSATTSGGSVSSDGPHANPALNLACNILYEVSGRADGDHRSALSGACTDQWVISSDAGVKCEDDLRVALGEPAEP